MTKQAVRTNEKPAITAEQAVELLNAEVVRKQEAFRKEYVELCQKHKLQLVGVPGITQDGRIGVQLTIRDIQDGNS